VNCTQLYQAIEFPTDPPTVQMLFKTWCAELRTRGALLLWMQASSHATKFRRILMEHEAFH